MYESHVRVGSARVNKAVSRSDLIIDGVNYETGIGVHLNSIVKFNLPEEHTRLKALVRID